MIQLVKEITKGLLEEEQKTVAVYGGGFKPPTKGHLEVVKQSLDENPEIDEYIIYVGKAERDGITLEDSLKVWDIYKKYLPSKVRVEKSIQPPIKSIYNYAKEHPQDEVLWVIGAREENEADFADISSRTKSISKYPNLELRTIVTKGGVSGTAARNAAKISPEKLNQFLPDFLSIQEKNDIFAILNNKVSEIQKPAKETEVDPIELAKGIKVEMEHTDDKAEAKVIALQHLAEDPKYYTKLAKVGLEEKVVGDKIVCDNCAWEWKIVDGGDDLYTCHKCWHDNTPISQLNENASYSQQIDVKQKIKELTQHMLDKGMNIRPLPKVIFKNGNTSNAKEFLGKTAYYDPNSMEVVLYTEGRHPKDIVRSFSHEMIHHIQNLENRLGNIITTNTTEDDHLTKLEQEANLRGTMTFRNWTDSIKGKNKKDLFGLNAFASELGRLREEEEKYKIYVDMDGVVADFEKRFEDLAGMTPPEFQSKYGKDAFWDFIDEGNNKIKFWVGIPPMEGAKQLIDYVSKHDYSMLTAPSIKKQSRLGKSLWIRNHVGKIFPSKPTVIFKYAKEKHKVKPSLTEKDILIDDKASTIDNWNAAGGTGILFTSASQAISELKKLGL